MPLSPEIIAQFGQWLADAKSEPSIAEPTAMSLATADSNGSPSLRIVLLKGFDERGFVFYTNLESHKSHDLQQNPRAALCFHWMPFKRQIRVEGIVKRVSDDEADAYFASRPRDSQLGAWASRQSQELVQREDLQSAMAEATKRFDGVAVTRPPFWSGWRVVADKIEFWHEGAHRLHQRDQYTPDGDSWKMCNLYP